MKRYQWWHAPLVIVLLLGFCAVATFFPYTSGLALVAGLGLMVLGGLAAVWYWLSANRFAAWLVGNALALAFLLVALRFWEAVVPSPYIWLVLPVGAYLLASVLPFLSPALSGLVFREEYAPQTALGRGCLAIALALGPSIAVVGAVLGLFSYRLAGRGSTFLVAGAFGSGIAILLAFTFTYAIFRPQGSGQPKVGTKTLEV